jgi:hypothetical protein
MVAEGAGANGAGAGMGMLIKGFFKGFGNANEKNVR